MRLFTRLFLLLCLGVFALGGNLRAQYMLPDNAFTPCSDFYFQDFDALPGGPFSFTNNTTLGTGWFLNTPGAYIGANNGGSSTGGYYSYGNTVERAFGMLATPVFPNPRIGFLLQNAGTKPIYSILVSYNGEQWRRGRNGNNPNVLAFEYLTGVNLQASHVNAPGPWTAVNPLDFTAPNNDPACAAGAGGALDGNDVFAPNKLSFFHMIEFSNPIMPGEQILFRWSISAHPTCANHGVAIDDLQIIPLNYPTNSDPNTDQIGAITGNINTCPGATEIYQVFNFADLSYTWNVAAPLSIIGGQGTPSVTVEIPPATPPGLYSLEVTAFSPDCGSGTPETIDIIVGSGPAASAGPDQSVCGPNGLATLVGNDPTPGTGTWTQIGGPAMATIGQVGTQLNVSQLNTAGVYTFRWTVSRPPCPSATDDVDIVVSLPPAGASVSTPSVSVCSASGIVTANAPTSGTGTWSFVSGPAVATVTTVGLNGSVNGMSVPGVYTFRWTVTSPGCPGSLTADATVTRVAPPTTANAGTDLFFCDPTTIQITGNAPVNGISQWFFVTGPATPVLNPMSNVLEVSSLTTPGVYIFNYVINNAPCPLSQDQVQVTVGINPTEPVNAGADVELCNQSTHTLTGSNPGPTNFGFWTWESGPTFAPVNTVGLDGEISGMVIPGTYTFRWNVFNSQPGTCPNLMDDVLVTVFDLPSAADAGTDQTLCNQPDAVLIGSVPTVGTAMWSIFSQPVGGNAQLAPMGNNAIVTQMDVPGDYVFEYTISSGPCTPSTDQVMITVLAPPTVPDAGPDQLICISSGSATLTGNAVAPTETGTWFFAGGPATPTVNQTGSNATVTGLSVAGCYNFFYVIDKPNCNSSADGVEVCVEPEPTTAVSGGDQTLCNDGNSFVIGNTPTIGTGDWSIVSGPLGATITTMGTDGVVTGPSGVYTLRWTISNPPCTDSFEDMQLTLVSPPTTANAGPDQSYCLGSITSVTMAGNMPAIGSGQWIVVSYPGATPPTITDPANPLTTATGFDQIGTYRFQWITLNLPCNISVDEMDVVITQPSVAGTITGGPTPVCAGTNTVTLTLNGYVGTIQRWQTSINSFATSNTLPTTTPTQIFTNLTSGIQVRAIVQNGNCPPETTATFLIQVVTQAIGGNITYTPGSPSTCATLSGGVLKLNGYFGTIARWESSTDNWATTTSIPHTSAIFEHGTLSQSTCFRAVVQNGTCPPVFSQPYCVQVNGLGTMNVSVDAGCNGLSTIFASVTGGAAPHDFFLVPTAGTIYQTGVITNVPAGTYTVYARDANYCYITQTVTVAPTVVSPPRVTSISPLTSVRAVLRWAPVPNATGVRYNLRISTSPTGPWTNYSTLNLQRAFTGLTPSTTYYVQLQSRCLTTPNVLSAWSSNVVFTTLSAREEALTASEGVGEVSLYPNPTRGQVNLNFSGASEGVLDLELLDLTGRRMSAQQLSLTAGDQVHSLDFSHLSAGVYLLNLRQGESRKTLKLIIE